MNPKETWKIVTSCNAHRIFTAIELNEIGMPLDRAAEMTVHSQVGGIEVLERIAMDLGVKVDMQTNKNKYADAIKTAIQEYYLERGDEIIDAAIGK